MKFLRKIPYWYLIVIPVLLFCLGVASNDAVLVANHGKFPVMMNEAQMYKHCSPEGSGLDPDELDELPAISCIKGGQMIDQTHSVMGPNSHLKILSDIFPLAGFIYSIGDAFLYLGDWLLSYTPIAWLALVLRKLISSS